MVIGLKFNKYAQACKDLDDEHMDIFQNILLPVLTGQSVIHIRTHEEPRLIGICEAIASRISADFKLLHVLTEAGVETSLLLGEDSETENYSALNIGREQNENYSSMHIRAVDAFVQSKEGGFAHLGSDSRQSDFVRKLKIHAKNGLRGEDVTDEYAKTNFSTQSLRIHPIHRDQYKITIFRCLVTELWFR